MAAHQSDAVERAASHCCFPANPWPESACQHLRHHAPVDPDLRQHQSRRQWHFPAMGTAALAGPFNWFVFARPCRVRLDAACPLLRLIDKYCSPIVPWSCPSPCPCPTTCRHCLLTRLSQLGRLRWVDLICHLSPILVIFDCFW